MYYYRAVLEGVHVGYGDIFIVILITDNPHHLVVVSIIQEGHVLTEAQVSHNDIEHWYMCCYRIAQRRENAVSKEIIKQLGDTSEGKKMTKSDKDQR